MQAIRTDFQPINRITTPLAGVPTYVNSGIIKAVMKSGEKISVEKTVLSSSTGRTALSFSAAFFECKSHARNRSVEYC